MMHAQLAHALTHRRDIAEIAQGETADPGVDPRLGLEIAQAREPRRITLRLADLDHLYTMGYTARMSMSALTMFKG